VPGEGLEHVGFKVDDVCASYKELVGNGARPTEVTPESTDGWGAYVKDPDGNGIDLHKG
jgi:hypothetical protein